MNDIELIKLELLEIKISLLKLYNDKIQSGFSREHIEKLIDETNELYEHIA